MDVVAFHLVTVGKTSDDASQELFKADNYAEYLYFHGLSVESAEALAELWTNESARNWELPVATQPTSTSCSTSRTRVRDSVLVIPLVRIWKTRLSSSNYSIHRASMWN